jgi:hypothetical protein
MHSPVTINRLLYASSLVVGSLVAAALLCNNTTDVAGGSSPDFDMPSSILTSAVKDFQFALFLENLELLFFKAGVVNLIKWSAKGYPNDTIEVVTKVAAVSGLAPNLRTLT